MARKPQAEPSRKEALQEALRTALAFPVARAEEIRLTRAAGQDLAQQEASFQKIAVDEDGLSPGMRLSLVQPAEALLAEWRQARSALDRLLQPSMKDIEAVRALEAEIVSLTAESEEARRSVERKLEANEKYLQIRARFRTAEVRWNQLRAENGNRDARMAARNPLYLLFIVLIGVAEWLINYDTFYSFLGVPAIAAGTTFVLGLLLAFAAHEHGALLKQWSARFGEHRERAKRAADWRMLVFSTFALLIVVGAAGASRYAAALSAQAAQAAPNILGADAAVPVDPFRDVAISLLGNVGAWLLGVFISYTAHDPDPDFMDAEAQYRRASRRYHRARRPAAIELRDAEAKFAKLIRDKTRSAQTRAGAVETERNHLAQADQHGEAIADAVDRVLAANVEIYRDALARIVLMQQGRVQITRRAGDQLQDLTPFDYKALKMKLPSLRGLAA